MSAPEQSAERARLEALIARHASCGFDGVMRRPGQGCVTYVVSVAQLDAMSTPPGAAS